MMFATPCVNWFEYFYRDISFFPTFTVIPSSGSFLTIELAYRMIRRNTNNFLFFTNNEDIFLLVASTNFLVRVKPCLIGVS